MIRTLTIDNVALIEHIQISFHSGMLVLSGETGAGKSIIVDAITLILGGRSDREIIRTGSGKASVEAEFETEPDERLDDLLKREQIDWDGCRLTLYREISLNGRNVCRINGVMVPVSFLKEVSSFLLNLHGQSEHQFLADEDRHLSYLDLMGDEAHQALIRETEAAYQKFIANHRAYAKLVRMNENREYRTDFLRRELEELRRAEIRPGEEKRLAEESRLLLKASRMQEKINRVRALTGSSDDGTDALHQLQNAVKELRSLENEDAGFGVLADQCDRLYYELEEVVYGIGELGSSFLFDPADLEKTETRLEAIRKAEKKYGPSEEDVLKTLQEMEEEYRTLEELDEKLQKTGADHKALLAAYRKKARELTESRKSIAEEFSRKMMRELGSLGMEHTVFTVSFEERSDGKPLMPSPSGDDRIRFMISPNPGEPLKPLSRIASGGELSRLMLAFKTIEAGRSGRQTMIFDEIDTGISGRMAQAVAEKMKSISRQQQVLCISHLPQIAAAADFQYLVHKQVREGRTVTDVEEMTPARRTDEIARMISGAEGITEDARKYAEQMINASHKILANQDTGRYNE
ncbi:MAG: DNA repair protein RecN [Clostridia bacterium]|nr:DNA repair protein RecN [Clostridia bacterium]